MCFHFVLKVLAKKMTVLYALAQEQLSKQCHYDWGLRSLNSVLRMAGVMKRQSDDLPEAVVLMRVLRDMNFPKFIFEDVPLFLGLIKVSSSSSSSTQALMPTTQMFLTTMLL